MPQPDPEPLRDLIDDMAGAVGGAAGTFLLYAAQFARTSSKYERADSLVWRDVGVIIGVTALVAEALGFCCCPLGPTGEPLLSCVLESAGRVRGVGGCVVGLPTASSG